MGGVLVLPVGTSVAIQTEALFAMKGAKEEESGSEGTLIMNYLELPILARFTIAARYNWGLRKITSDEDTKNRVLSFVLGFEWPMGRQP